MTDQMDYSNAVIALGSRIGFIQVHPDGLTIAVNGEYYFVAVAWRDFNEVKAEVPALER